MKDQRLGGRFYLEKKIGSGGMATVYLGKDEVLDRPVAVKVLKPDLMESDVGARFRREGRTAARLSHPNIVQVYDAREEEFEGETVSYIVMEHVSGGDLKALISNRGTLLGEEISNLSGVAAGLAHAHERGIIHRDIKPHNILLSENGSPKLADFGIARAMDATQATRTGIYMGTARYSSPEQLKGGEVTTKSDVYSLGAMLYEAVVGHPPFSGTPIEIASQHVSKPPPPPGETSLVDEDLESLILSCLSKNPEDRPTAIQVRDRLSGITHDATDVATGAAVGAAAAVADTDAAGEARDTASVAEPTPVRGAASTRTRNSSRRAAPLLVALVGLLVVLGGLGAFTLLTNEDPQVQAPANTTREPTQAPVGNPQQDGQTTVEPAPQNTESQPATPQPATTQPATPAPDENESQPGSGPEEQASQAVQNAYQLAAEGEYDESYGLLTQNFKQQTEAYTLAQWGGRFDTLQRISFIEGPNANVSGNTAIVTGVTRAVHDDRIERNTVTWTVVREDGEWKLDRINSFDQELV